LAYTVYAAWSANYDYPGLFLAGGQTRAESTADFIRAIRAEIERIRDEAITPAELQAAKDKTLNSFIFNFADPDQTLSRLIRYEYYGYPADFIFQYQRGIEATTIADVQRVARTYLTPEDLTILVVGNAAQITPSLDSLDPDRTAQSIDISIPAAR
jgi:zinc protease